MLKKRLYEILEPSHDNDIISKIFDIFIVILITLNIAAVIASSFDNIYEKYHIILNNFEIFSIIILQ